MFKIAERMQYACSFFMQLLYVSVKPLWAVRKEQAFRLSTYLFENLFYFAFVFESHDL